SSAPSVAREVGVPSIPSPCRTAIRQDLRLVGCSEPSLAGFGGLRYLTRRHEASAHRVCGGWHARLRCTARVRRYARSDLDSRLLGRRRLRRRDRSHHVHLERDRDGLAVRARDALGADLDAAAGRRPAGSEPGLRSAPASRSSARLPLPWMPTRRAGGTAGSRRHSDSWFAQEGVRRLNELMQQTERRSPGAPESTIWSSTSRSSSGATLCAPTGRRSAAVPVPPP